MFDISIEDDFALAAAAAALLCATVVSLALPSEAEACGGFVCDQNQPINQADENIVFSSNGDGTVTAVIQIRYQGPSEKFAWLLPVPGKPEVGVSSSTVFQRLTQATNPNYQMNTTVEGQCQQSPPRGSTSGGGGLGSADTGAAGADAGGDGGVTVVDGGAVGPYNYDVISVDDMTDDPAQAAIDWLEKNDYDLPNTGPKLLGDYLGDGMNLIAFKLSKDAQSGEIRPVELTYEHPLPMIPLKLTAIAAQRDMGVRVWVAAKDRAVPTRFKSVQVNPAAINWFNAGSSYNDVITEAANEVGGKAFVTEYAGDPSIVSEQIFQPNDEREWNKFNDPSAWSGREGSLLIDTIQAYRRWDGILRVVRNEVPLSGGFTAQEFVRQPYGLFTGDETDIERFDVSSYLQALEDNVVGPVRDAEKMLQDRPHLTRLFTTVSPDEMVMDPTFDFSSQLPDISNSHVAERTIYCSSEVTRREAPWKATLPDGTVVWGEGRNWPFGTNNIEAAKKAKQFNMGPKEGTTVDTFEQDIDRRLEEHNSGVKEAHSSSDSDGSSGGMTGTTGSTTGSSADGGMEDFDFKEGPTDNNQAGCACRSTGGVPTGWLFALGLLGLLRLRRRD